MSQNAFKQEVISQMACKACKFDHPAMQDCKVAARIRAATERVESVKYIEKKRNSATVKAKHSVALPVNATVVPVSSVALPVDATVGSTMGVAFEHPNVYPNPYDLGWDKLAKTSTQRSREHRARKAP
jgi:hypothetical protein